jgi:hypothetical protein
MADATTSQLLENLLESKRRDDSDIEKFSFGFVHNDRCMCIRVIVSSVCL